MKLSDLVEQGAEAVKHGDLVGVEKALDALHALSEVTNPTTDRGIAELVRAMGARLGTALRMVDELQADNTRLLEERRAVEARLREVEKDLRYAQATIEEEFGGGEGPRDLSKIETDPGVVEKMFDAWLPTDDEPIFNPSKPR